MPVQKFRSVEDMPRPPWEGTANSVELRRRIAGLWARAARISPRVYPRGIFKFRSLEEAQEARDRVTSENVTRLLQERARGTSL